MADVTWPRGSIKYKVGQTESTSTGVRVRHIGEKIRLTAMRMTNIPGACHLEFPVSMIDQVVDAIYEAREAQKAKAVKRQISRMK